MRATARVREPAHATGEHGPRLSLRRRRWIALAAASILGSALAFSPVGAQDESLRLQVDLLVPPLQNLLAEPAVLAFPVPTAAHLEAGHLDLETAALLTVFSNGPWTLFLRLQSDCPTPEGNRGCPGLSWAVQGRTFAALGPEWTVIAHGDTPADGLSLRLSLRLRLSWTEGAPGTYTPGIEYRLDAGSPSEMGAMRP